MGVTIHHTLAQARRDTKATLDNTEALARRFEIQAVQIGVPFEIRRLSDTSLLVDIGQCETLAFEFAPMPSIEQQRAKYNDSWDSFKEWRQHDHAGEHYERYPEQLYLWCNSFCKTQFAHELLQHRMVAELIRATASRCQIAYVYDEGDYYHTGRIEDASEAISENGKMINGLVAQLEGTGWDTSQCIKGGDTFIKPIKKTT